MHKNAVYTPHSHPIFHTQAGVAAAVFFSFLFFVCDGSDRPSELSRVGVLFPLSILVQIPCYHRCLIPLSIMLAAI